MEKAAEQKRIGRKDAGRRGIGRKEQYVRTEIGRQDPYIERLGDKQNIER